MRWHDFAEQATELASRGWDLLAESHGYAFLATTAPDGSPRVNPVAPIRSDQGLFVAIMNTSPKLADVRRDPRIALHASVAAPDDEEFSLRGLLNEVPDPEARKAAVAGARDGAELSDSVTLFEVDLHHASWALWTTRPPRRTHWRAH